MVSSGVSTQRISTAMSADRIYVLDKGCIIGVGTHSELLAKAGTYAEMWNVQAEKYCAELEA